MTAAFQGHGWRPRRKDKAEEFSVNSEYMELRDAQLYLPGRELNSITRPRSVQFLRNVDARKLRREILSLSKALRRCGVRVNYLNPKRIPRAIPPPNLVFQRDLFFNTPHGVILSRMASEIRAGEEKFAAAELTARRLTIRQTISEMGTFEGADALWLDPRSVLLGVGTRTNLAAAKQIAAALKGQGVRVYRVKMPKGVQHLLGIIQIVDQRLAVVRRQKLPASLVSLLRRRSFRLVELDETADVCEKQGMNFITVRPRQIIMAANCPELKTIYCENGIRVLAEVEISQLLDAAGGIACATGILSRRPRRD